MRLSLENNPVAYIGAKTTRFLGTLGRTTIFFAESLMRVFTFPFPMVKIIDQIYFIGVKSIFVICLTALFTGMVLGLQGYYTLVKFGSEGLLGTAVALTLVRELGPVLTAIMVIARAGSAMTAEIGIMRISEQIDALETMNLNPVKFLVSPRIAAAVICFPILTAIFDIVGIAGGFMTGSLLLGINPYIYYYRAVESVVMADVTGGFIKALAFAAIVNTVCCYNGYFTHLRTDDFGSKGVSLSTTSAVVNSCIIVLIVDYILTSFLL